MRVKIMCVCKYDLCDTGAVLYQYHCPLAFCQLVDRYIGIAKERRTSRYSTDRRSGEDWELLDRLMKADIS